MQLLLFAILSFWTALRVDGEVIKAKLATVNNNGMLMGVSMNNLFARDELRPCPNGDGPNCGGGCECCAGESCCSPGCLGVCCPAGTTCCSQEACCTEAETCCSQSGNCAFPGWECYGMGIVPKGSDHCGNSHYCEPGSSCVQCPKNSPFYPYKYCCDKPQIPLRSYIPSGYSLASSLSFLSFSVPSGSIPSLTLPSFSSTVGAGFPSSSSYSQQSSQAQQSSQPKESSQGQQSSVGINYQYYTTSWIYYYIVWYVTTIQESSTTITSSTTTETTALTCYAANQQAASSQFSTIEETVSAAATSVQSSISASLFAQQGRASASQQGGSHAHSTRVDAATVCLLILTGLLPGVLAVLL